MDYIPFCMEDCRDSSSATRAWANKSWAVGSALAESEAAVMDSMAAFGSTGVSTMRTPETEGCSEAMGRGGTARKAKGDSISLIFWPPRLEN